MHSMPANLAGWSSATARAAVSPTKSWIGVAIAATVKRDDEAEPVVAVAAATQHPDGVDRGDQEAGDHVGGEEHVEELVAGRRVEEDLERLHVGDLAGGVEREALRLVHPGVRGDTEKAPPTPEITIGTAGPACGRGARAGPSRRCRSR